jgi:hypothetical protein
MEVPPILANVLAVPLDVLIGSEIAPVILKVARVGAPVADVRAEVPLVAPDICAVLLDLAGPCGLLVLSELAPIPGEVTPVMPNVPIVLMYIPPILAYVLTVLSDPPVLGVRGAVTQRQHYRSYGHCRQRLHRSLRSRNLTA